MNNITYTNLHFMFIT